jgi:hypothetical protein
MNRFKPLLLSAILVLGMSNQGFCFCFEEAGAEYRINPQILRAIAKVESNFNPAAVNKNSNGTYDVGLMQINSSWASTIGKERWKKLGDACYNTKTGAWILSMCMNKYGYNWKAIGCYNSQTPGKRDRYAKMVFDQLQRVKPRAEEAAYTPLKSQVEELVRDNVENWVDDAAQGKKAEFKVKVPAGALAHAAKGTPKEAVQEPPTLTGSATQLALPTPALSLNAASAAADGSEEPQLMP